MPPNYSQMSEEKKEVHRASVREYRLRNHEVTLEREKKGIAVIRKRKTALIHEAKDVPCADCGLRYPHVVMDFHHRDPDLKEANISKIVTWSDKRLLAEIAKCEVLCANCHRLLHWEPRGVVPVPVIAPRPEFAAVISQGTTP